MMRSSSLMTLIFSGIIMLLLMACNSNIEFTRIVQGNAWKWEPNDGDSYREIILVKNMPKDTLEQSKIMIAYFDSVGLSKNYLSSKMPEIRYYSMFFYKSTYITRRHFIEQGKYWVENKRVPSAVHRRSFDGNKTYLGNILMVHCKDDATKWRVLISRRFRTYEFLKGEGFYVRNALLLNECSYNWYESEKDKERGKVLVEYYMELRNKKNAEH